MPSHSRRKEYVYRNSTNGHLVRVKALKISTALKTFRTICRDDYQESTADYHLVEVNQL